MSTTDEALDALMAGVMGAVCEHILMPQRCGCGADWECKNIKAAVRKAAIDLVITELEAAANNEDNGCLCADAQVISDMPRLCGAHRRIAELRSQREEAE